METRRHIILEEPFAVSPERMFETLITPSAIRGWWGASKAIVVPEEGGVWIAAWGEDENDSDYISSFKILEFEPPNRMLLGDGKYFSKDGTPPFEMKMTTEFVVEPNVGGGCALRIIQDGFPTDPVADEFFDASIVGWKNTFEGMRKYFYDNPS